MPSLIWKIIGTVLWSTIIIFIHTVLIKELWKHPEDRETTKAFRIFVTVFGVICALAEIGLFAWYAWTGIN